MASRPLEYLDPAVTRASIIGSAGVVESILSRFDRAKLAAFVAVAIDLIDAMDGDPDIEDDDLDTGVEDAPEGFDPEVDCCIAGDDGVFSGSHLGGRQAFGPGDAVDAEIDDGSEFELSVVPIHAFKRDEVVSGQGFIGYANMPAGPGT